MPHQNVNQNKNFIGRETFYRLKTKIRKIIDSTPFSCRKSKSEEEKR